jgi:hypothetical protein
MRCSHKYGCTLNIPPKKIRLALVAPPIHFRLVGAVRAVEHITATRVPIHNVFNIRYSSRAQPQSPVANSSKMNPRLPRRVWGPFSQMALYRHFPLGHRLYDNRGPRSDCSRTILGFKTTFHCSPRFYCGHFSNNEWRDQASLCGECPSAAMRRTVAEFVFCKMGSSEDGASFTRYPSKRGGRGLKNMAQMGLHFPISSDKGLSRTRSLKRGWGSNSRAGANKRDPISASAIA